MLLMVVAGACSSSGSVPNIDAATAADLQIRAIMRSCAEIVCSGAAIYAPDSMAVQIKEAMLQFTNEAEYLSSSQIEAAFESGGFEDGGTLFQPDVPYDTNVPGVAGVDVWNTRGFEGSVRRTFLFAWDGTNWDDTTPDATGVTVTSSVS